MKIRSLQLKNFKRFTDLTLEGIPDNAKLVLLIGSNGSGKSSVFDAFDFLSLQYGKIPRPSHLNFFKDKSILTQEVFVDTLEYGKQGLTADGWIGSAKIRGTNFYGRTSFRQIPRITRTKLGKTFNLENDTDKPVSFIDRDERFENDLEHILGKLLKEFFRTTNDKSEIKKNVIDPINESLQRIFPGENGTRLQLIQMIPPLEGNVADVTFRKGVSEFHYNYLSAGEKEIFNILINFVARKEYYNDTVFFFDEIDLHLNTKLQYSFIKELVENWIPENCQFWTASHSLGFIQYAKQNENAVIFDLDDLDFDYAKVLLPEPKDNPDVYEIAVNKELLPELFKDYEIFFVENKDRNYYSALNLSKILFVQANNKKAVYHKTKNGDFSGIVDRDFLTDSDILEIEKQYPKLKILRLYSIENYLYHPDNLQEYYNSITETFDKSSYINSIIVEKEKIKPQIFRSLALIRTGYSFFEEPEHNGKEQQKRFKNDAENLAQVAELELYLNSNDFESFYKIFPMKDNATQLKERQNISKSDLAKTNWFKKQIENIIQ